MPCLGVLLSGEEADKAEFEHTGHIFLLHESQRYNQSFFEPKLLRPCFDHELAKHWLDYCSKNHKSCQDDADEVEVLKLIDCSLNSPAVVPAPRAAKYIALSYVWGSPKKLPDVQTADLSPDDSKFSKTIRDAITATQQLGVQYLWVDKHCINQDDAQEKHNQISRMDRIYRGAVATIIAVAGNNADHGLPGVGDTFREQQPVAICQDFTLMSTMTHPHSSITSSSWNSRAWTFQESVLSRRRLVFTENQIYFECDVMNCVESLP
ncbi:HET-domain-containing protein, partial [Mollisia scopiformis]